MILGVDLDNTLACFDDLFPALALRRGVVPAEAAIDKRSVRDHLRAVGRKSVWTELQGLAYGPGMIEAKPFAGVREALGRLRAAGVRVCVVSHRTRRPVIGEAHDLHAAARSWLQQWGFFDGAVGIAPDQVFLEITKADKLARIAAIDCAAFIDDLPELLRASGFPSGVHRILFDPTGAADGTDLALARTWNEVEAIVSRVCRL